ncbi:MAG: hypothetical protein NWE96_00705 [Candidatus Bathyarchaeota archaeon]|nr:hypothetical protein [Candidatus Bathyarchaeota archaeon]
MQKTNQLALSVLAAVLLSSALFSVASAQETGTIEPAAPDPSALPEPSVDADAAAKAADGNVSSGDGNATAPDTPVGYGDDVIYTIQGDDAKAMVPGAEDANLLSAQATPDYSMVFAAIGIAIPVIIGAALGLVVHHRKQAVKTQIAA